MNFLGFKLALSWYFTDFLVNTPILNMWMEGVNALENYFDIPLHLEMMPVFTKRESLKDIFKKFPRSRICSLHSSPHYPRLRYPKFEDIMLCIAKYRNLPLIIHAVNLNDMKEYEQKQFFEKVSRFRCDKEEYPEIFGKTPVNRPITLLIENNVFKKSEQSLNYNLEEIAIWVQELQNQWPLINFGLVLDIGHMEGSIKSTDDLIKAYQITKPKIIHFHDFLPFKERHTENFTINLLYRILRRTLTAYEICSKTRDYGLREECHINPGEGKNRIFLKEFAEFLKQDYQGILTIELGYQLLKPLGLKKVRKIIKQKIDYAILPPFVSKIQENYKRSLEFILKD